MISYLLEAGTRFKEITSCNRLRAQQKLADSRRKNEPLIWITSWEHDVLACDHRIERLELDMQNLEEFGRFIRAGAYQDRVLAYRAATNETYLRIIRGFAKKERGMMQDNWHD